MKIGIYAGTFDPIHRGHTVFALESIKAASLDKVIVVAEKDPYRKKPEASWDHRQAMIERATQNIEQVDHDYAFANMLSHQHTMADVLNSAKLHYGKENKVWFLVGSDVFEHFHKWHDLVDKIEYGGFIIALRDNHTKEWLLEQTNKTGEKGKNINTIIIDSPNPHISSSGIREACKNNQMPNEIEESVLAYINEHNLYK